MAVGVNEYCWPTVAVDGGVPLIEGAICTIECRVKEQVPGGDHSIFIGEVVDAQTGEGKPLVYYRSGYRQISV